MDRRWFLKAVSCGAYLAAASELIPRLMAADEAPPGSSAPGSPAKSPSRGGAAGALGSPLDSQTRQGDMIYRVLGHTGERVSALGVGGAHIGKQKDEQDSIRLIRAAIDHGFTYMDNSWDYNGGQSEIRMGKALRDGYRDKVFLMTKVDGRTKASAQQQLDESLTRLQTDHIDLWQFHEIIRMEDPDRIFAAGGALETALAAQQAGKIRYIGFTGHKDPLIHLRMLEIARANSFHFDAVLFPINVMDAHFRSFRNQVLPVAQREGIAVTSMKPIGSGVILKSGTVKAPECLRYALSQPTCVVTTGMETMDDLNQALEVARTFKPMTREEVAALLERTTQAAAHGRFELFKTETRFDSTGHHPEWLG